MNFIIPAALSREDAAQYVGMSLSSFEKAVRKQSAPKPRQCSERCVIWLRTELDAWVQTLPHSTILPPENTGAKKPRFNAANSPNAQKAA